MNGSAARVLVMLASCSKGAGLERAAGALVLPLTRLRIAQSCRPALADIIGARLAWTVAMISSVSMPCRYLRGREVVGIPLPPLAVEVGKPAMKRRKRKPVAAPRPVGDGPRTSVPARRAGR